MEWYNAIRCANYNRLKVAYPGASDEEVSYFGHLDLRIMRRREPGSFFYSWLVIMCMQ